MYEVNSFLWRFSSESRSGLAETLCINKAFYIASFQEGKGTSIMPGKQSRLSVELLDLSSDAWHAVMQNGKLSATAHLCS